ncbi:Structural protein, phage associated [Leuconostoc pseudomesenteroides 4882]|nr:Structural protein, phage associated [Leuconostoc pseudomesenteroides 4882]
MTPIYTPTPLPPHTDWIRVSITFKCVKDPTTSIKTLRWEGQNALTNGFIQFAGYKLEEGNTATDWTPAPEDVQSDIAQVKVTADNISKFVRDPSGNISYDFQTALSKTSIITGSTLASSIQTQTATQITSAFNDGNGKFSKLQQKVDGFEATVTKVDNLSVGGRNLLLGTRDWTDNTRWNQRGTVTKDVYRGMVIASTGGAWSSPVYMMQNAGILQVGKTYTFSTYVRNTSDTDTNVAPYYEGGIVTPIYTPTPLPPHTDWIRVSITFKCVKDPTTSIKTLRWEGQNALTNGFIQFAGYKLEEGNTATDWTPAPEDVQSDIAQVKVTADNISKFVRDPSGNISYDFQTALSKTSIITGSTLASSIQTQTATQISSALTDNNGKIISLINQDSSGVQIAGKNLDITADTTVDGKFWAKQVNAVKVNATNITVGTLNGNQVNITNINANNIVSGAISGANLNINLNTGSVVFQKGRINSSDYTTDINIDQGYISTANGDTRALLAQGKLQLIAPTLFNPQTDPYLEISNNSDMFNGMSALIKARTSLTLSINGYQNRGNDTPLSTEKFVGVSIGRNNSTNNKLIPTKIGGAEQGVVISGGANFTMNGIGSAPYIYVGSDSYGAKPNGDRIFVNASYFHSMPTYNRTSSRSANVVVAADGALVRSSSARKYKLDIKNNIPIADSLKLIEVPLSTWIDKHEHEENGSNERYFGMIAEDLRDARLEYLVQYGDDNEVEGINYDRVALLLIPLVKELKERIEELESEGK